MDDEQHKREEEDRRAKRKASKLSKSEAQIAKERKRDEHRKKILKQQGGSASTGTRTKDAAVGSKFQELFHQRAQGFQIDFRFRNAPPRPPVGPTFVGQTLEIVLNDLCRQYKQHNAVETNFTWRLHSEPDLGVPLAPSAMDLKSYPKGEEVRGSSSKPLSLHSDDDALLNWKGSMGDTAADNLKKRQERARAATRAALGSKSAAAVSGASQYTQRPNKKAFSRVLDEGMQSWMKKTTYLSNDYSRKVHDFKSLAQTKQELAIDLATKQEELSKHRSVHAINQSFDFDKCPLQHPTKKNMQPKSILSLLPNVSHYGRAYTHVVVDKAPALEKRFKMQDLDAAFIAHVEKKEANARMTCQLLLPTTDKVTDDDDDDALAEEDVSYLNYQAAHAFNLDVVPLKEEESPHVNFCFWVDEHKKEATYLPISSRVQLSSGRPIENGGTRKISRRELTITEREEMEEGMAEVDADLAEKHHVSFNRPLRGSSINISDKTASRKGQGKSYAQEREDDDDDEEDFGDDNDDSSDSGDEILFGATQKKIVVEG